MHVVCVCAPFFMQLPTLCIELPKQFGFIQVPLLVHLYWFSDATIHVNVGGCYLVKHSMAQDQAYIYRLLYDIRNHCVYFSLLLMPYCVHVLVHHYICTDLLGSPPC